MAQPLAITIIRDPTWQLGDLLQLEVAGVTQPDRINAYDLNTPQSGFGFGSFGNRRFGFGPRPGGLGFGFGAFGYFFGREQPLMTFGTVKKFVANDFYSIRLRATDSTGNVGSWTGYSTVQHRPNPPAPDNLSCTANILTWTWSDP